MDEYTNLPVNRLFSDKKNILNLAKYSLIVSEEEYAYITSPPFIRVGQSNISINYLKKIISSPKYYGYINRFFVGNVSSFSISCLSKNEITKTLSFNKVTIIKAFAKAIEEKKLELSDSEKEKLAALKKAISKDAFIRTYKNQNISFVIDGVSYDISGERFIALMALDEDRFINICQNPNIKSINRIPKEHFLYALKVFFSENDFFKDYELPDSYAKRFDDITSCKYIDIQAINRHKSTNDVLPSTVSLSKELIDHVLYNMPQDISDIEKACYIYIKLARTLVYDEEYFATCQKGINTKKHKDVNYVDTITPENNQIVCFEFNLIFAKFLTMLGLNLKTNYTNSSTENYGDVHANLEFRCNKFIVRADSVTSILQGDLFRAKVGTRLIGLKCMNKNEATKEEFNQALNRMYNLIANQELLINFANGKPSYVNYNDTVREYQKLARSIPKISLQDKVKTIFNKVTSSGLSGVDTYSYIMSLMLVIFDTKERFNNISFTVISDYDPSQKDKEAMPLGVFAINNYGLDESEEPNTYYLYSPYYNYLVPISKEELQMRFDEDRYVYMPDFDGIIVGIHGGRK